MARTFYLMDNVWIGVAHKEGGYHFHEGVKYAIKVFDFDDGKEVVVANMEGATKENAGWERFVSGEDIRRARVLLLSEEDIRFVKSKAVERGDVTLTNLL